jgi:type IV secretory pathway VirB2 component (pilin)
MRIKPCKYAVVLFVFLGTGLWAQQTLQLRWQLYYVSGAVSLHSAKGQSIPVGGAFLEYGDMIQTTSGEAELQLVFDEVSRADYALLKLGDNTSIRIGEERGGSPSIELLYGRIRLVSGIASDRIVSVVGGASRAEFKDADAGVDYMILSKSSASPQPVLMVHIFRGSGGLLPVRESLLDVSRLPLRDGQTMMAEFNTPFSYVERRSLDADVVSYWDRRGFSGAAPLAIPGVLLPRTENTPPTEKNDISFALELPQDTADGTVDTSTVLLRNKKIGIGIGLFFIAAGIGMQAFSASGNDLFGDDFLGRDTKTFLSLGAYSSMGFGSVILFSLILNDP